MCQNLASKLELQVELHPFKKGDASFEALSYAKLAEEYFGETEENRQDSIEGFRKKLLEQDPSILQNIPGGDSDRFMLKILRAGTRSNELGGLDVSNAAKLLKNLVWMMKSGPKYFEAAFEPGHNVLRQGYAQRAHTILTHRDKFGRRVYFWRPGSWDPDKVSMQTMFACGYALLEMVSVEEKTQIAGVTCVCDASNFGFKHMRNISIEDMKYLALFGQEHFPLWYRQIHVINFPRFARIAFDLAKPLMNERSQNLIIFHDSNESLHKYLDREILPEEYGGFWGKFSNQECAEKVHEMQEQFAQTKRYIADIAEL